MENTKLMHFINEPERSSSNILISFTNNYRLLARIQFQDNLAMIDNIEDIKGLCYFGMTLYFYEPFVSDYCHYF